MRRSSVNTKIDCDLLAKKMVEKMDEAYNHPRDCECQGCELNDMLLPEVQFSIRIEVSKMVH